MTHLEPEKPPAALVKVNSGPADASANPATATGRGRRAEMVGEEFTASSLLAFGAKVSAIVAMEIQKLRHDPTELFTRALQPVLWLTIFGQAMSRIRAVPTGGYTYLQFMTPGILAQSVVFIAIFYGLSIIWERDMGILQKFLVTPTPRLALVVGKMVSAGIRGLSQALIVILVALFLRIDMQLSLLGALGVFTFVMLGAGFFAGLSMTIASLVKTRERFMGIGQVITMPLFFASNALYPLSIMPLWLRLLSSLNPLSYLVEALRGLLVTGNIARLPLDLAFLLAVNVLIAGISAVLYPRVVL